MVVVPATWLKIQVTGEAVYSVWDTIMVSNSTKLVGSVAQPLYVARQTRVRGVGVRRSVIGSYASEQSWGGGTEFQ
jgi:hypothetical protein